MNIEPGRIRYRHNTPEPPRDGASQPASAATPSGEPPAAEPFWPADPPRSPAPPGALPSFDAWQPDLPPPDRPRRRWLSWHWISRALAALILVFVLLVAWLAVTAPLSQSLKPPTPPSITLTDRNGTPIARRGAIIGAPVDAARLPGHVREAFIAIEDRRFYSHWGIDPRGIARAAWHNLRGGGVREGGSTITQQLAKNAFLDSDRTAARKLREVMISFWLEAWLSKDEILSRYLSNVYFGDNVYGLTAASKHYFGRTPDKLNVGQAAMLAGLVKAPSRLAPTGNLKGARDREAVVVGAMVAAGFLTKAEGEDVQPQRVLAAAPERVPTGTYFADWVLPDARDQAGEIRDEATVRTTLDRNLQATAERVIARAGLKKAQAALVAMRPDGEIVAMVGGRDYAKSPFNRATQARRQPGSTFKLFVYLAAMRDGLTPTSTVEDRPVQIANWKPRNDDGRYLGDIPLTRAFARSSNVAAARLTQQVGVRSVIRAARDLGITTPIANEATIGLGTSEVSLLELTAAYAAIRNGSYPVQPHGLTGTSTDQSWYARMTSGPTKMPANIQQEMLTLLGASIRGTGRAAALTVPSWGKTGTSQSGRDAWFVGFAGDLVVGVWVGNDDNTPNPGLHGGGIPAQIWRNFMVSALDIAPVVKPTPVPEDAIDPEVIYGEDDPVGALIDQVGPVAGQVGSALNGPVNDAINGAVGDTGRRLRGLGIDLRQRPDGSLVLEQRGRSRDLPPPDTDRIPRDSRRAPSGDDIYDEQ